MARDENGEKRSPVGSVLRYFADNLRKGFTLEQLLNGQRKVLLKILPEQLAGAIELVSAFLLLHVLLLYAMVKPAVKHLRQSGVKVFECGGWTWGRFGFPRVRAEVAVMLLAVSAAWSCFSVPNPLSVIRWGLTVRPQINVRPQITIATKSHSSPALVSNSDHGEHEPSMLTQKRSKSDMDLLRLDKVDADVRVNLRVSNTIDDFLSGIQCLSNTVDAASDFTSALASSVDPHPSEAQLDTQVNGETTKHALMPADLQTSASVDADSERSFSVA
ncbi:hypothetical protein AAVH_10188 [Aphelenchoides avenae]|nr:hypothetical protein AAVH_10188 [Aphelenchus avenae]